MIWKIGLRYSWAALVLVALSSASYTWAQSGSISDGNASTNGVGESHHLSDGVEAPQGVADMHHRDQARAPVELSGSRSEPRLTLIQHTLMAQMTYDDIGIAVVLQIGHQTAAKGG